MDRQPSDTFKLKSLSYRKHLNKPYSKKESSLNFGQRLFSLVPNFLKSIQYPSSNDDKTEDISGYLSDDDGNHNGIKIDYFKTNGYLSHQSSSNNSFDDYKDAKEITQSSSNLFVTKSNFKSLNIVKPIFNKDESSSEEDTYDSRPQSIGINFNKPVQTPVYQRSKIFNDTSQEIETGGLNDTAKKIMNMLGKINDIDKDPHLYRKTLYHNKDVKTSSSNSIQTPTFASYTNSPLFFKPHSIKSINKINITSIKKELPNFTTLESPSLSRAPITPSLTKIVQLKSKLGPPMINYANSPNLYSSIQSQNISFFRPDSTKFYHKPKVSAMLNKSPPIVKQETLMFKTEFDEDLPEFTFSDVTSDIVRIIPKNTNLVHKSEFKNVLKSHHHQTPYAKKPLMYQNHKVDTSSHVSKSQMHPFNTIACTAPLTYKGSCLDVFNIPSDHTDHKNLEQSANITDKWKCSDCWVNNTLHSQKCVCCGAPNPNLKKSTGMIVLTTSSTTISLASFSNTIKSPAFVGNKVCQICLHKNQPDLLHCKICNTLLSFNFSSPSQISPQSKQMVTSNIVSSTDSTPVITFSSMANISTAFVPICLVPTSISPNITFSALKGESSSSQSSLFMTTSTVTTSITLKLSAPSISTMIYYQTPSPSVDTSIPFSFGNGISSTSTHIPTFQFAMPNAVNKPNISFSNQNTSMSQLFGQEKEASTSILTTTSFELTSTAPVFNWSMPNIKSSSFTFSTLSSASQTETSSELNKGTSSGQSFFGSFPTCSNSTIPTFSFDSNFGKINPALNLISSGSCLSALTSSTPTSFNFSGNVSLPGFTTPALSTTTISQSNLFATTTTTIQSFSFGSNLTQITNSSEDNQTIKKEGFNFFNSTSTAAITTPAINLFSQANHFANASSSFPTTFLFGSKTIESTSTPASLNSLFTAKLTQPSTATPSFNFGSIPTSTSATNLGFNFSGSNNFGTSNNVFGKSSVFSEQATTSATPSSKRGIEDNEITNSDKLRKSISFVPFSSAPPAFDSKFSFTPSTTPNTASTSMTPFGSQIKFGSFTSASVPDFGAVNPSITTTSAGFVFGSTALSSSSLSSTSTSLNTFNQPFNFVQPSSAIAINTTSNPSGFSFGTFGSNSTTSKISGNLNALSSTGFNFTPNFNFGTVSSTILNVPSASSIFAFGSNTLLNTAPSSVPSLSFNGLNANNAIKQSPFVFGNVSQGVQAATNLAPNFNFGSITSTISNNNTPSFGFNFPGINSVGAQQNNMFGGMPVLSSNSTPFNFGGGLTANTIAPAPPSGGQPPMGENNDNQQGLFTLGSANSLGRKIKKPVRRLR